MQRKMARIVFVVGIVAVGGCVAPGQPDEDPDQAQVESGLQASGLSVSHQLRNAAWGGCMNAPGNALNVILNIGGVCGYFVSPNSLTWRFQDHFGPISINNAYAPNYCVEVNNGTNNPGERVDEFTCNGFQSELWTQEAVLVDNVSYVRFHSWPHPNMCLDTVGGAGSQLMQWPCDPLSKKNKAQMWIVQ